jgi:hypothetical protein
VWVGAKKRFVEPNDAYLSLMWMACCGAVTMINGKTCCSAQQQSRRSKRRHNYSALYAINVEKQRSKRLLLRRALCGDYKILAKCDDIFAPAIVLLRGSFCSSNRGLARNFDGAGIFGRAVVVI